MRYDIINPYSPSASKKIKRSINPVNILDSLIYPRTPQSPNLPIEIPANSEDNPTHQPAAQCKLPAANL